MSCIDTVIIGIVVIIMMETIVSIIIISSACLPAQATPDLPDNRGAG
eukprot:SAG22_NODE_11227_length_494_cov_23.253165_1_plen_46_part_10